MATAAAVRKEHQKNSQAHYETAGATLLAMQPARPKPEDAGAATNEWNIIRNHLEQRIVSLRTWRQSWWTQNWSDLAEFILPRRSIWLTQSAGGIPTPNNMTRGRPINTAIVDPTATYAMRVCCGGLVNGLASPSRPWFKIIPAVRQIKIDTAGRQWLDETQDRIYTVLATSNFYKGFATEIEDLAVFGTGTVIVYEDDRDIIRLYNPAIGEFYLSCGATGRTDGFYRQFLMTVDQAVDFFGADNVTPDIQSLWKQKGSGLQTERIVAHSIEPNYAIGKTGVGVIEGNFTWREIYWVWGANATRPLSKRGFVENPFTASCWARQSNDAYGRSLGMDILPDVAQLQVMTRRMAEAIEKQVRPPLIADMQLKNQPSSTLPGHVTYATNLGPSTGMRPIYTVEPDVAAMAANILAIQNRIKTGAFNDLFLLLQEAPGTRKTAYEVAQMMQEKLQIIGPVIESLITESLKPKLRRIFAICKRRGIIEPPPPSLQNIPLDVEFISMLALAQKAASTGGIERLVAFVGSMAPLFPEAKDNVNADSLVQVMNDLLGNPEKILNGPEALAQIRKANAQMAAHQQQLAAATQIATAAGKAAPAAQVLSNIATGAHGEGQGSPAVLP